MVGRAGTALGTALSQAGASVVMIIETGDQLDTPALSESLLASPVLTEQAGATLLPQMFSLDAVRTAAPAVAEPVPVTVPAGESFVKQSPPMRRTDSTPSLMSRQLSAWSDMDDPELAMPAERLRAHHRRCRSEGVGFQSVKLSIHLPPLPDSASSEPLVVHISVPAFYTAKQTIVSALHECRRRLPSAAWRTLDQRLLELRLMQDDEPQPHFDMPALASGTVISAVGETELALCTRGDEAAWHVSPSDVSSPIPPMPTVASDSNLSPHLRAGAGAGAADSRPSDSRGDDGRCVVQ